MNFKAAKDYCDVATYTQREFTHRFLDSLTFRADDVVLDVGCGTGEETQWIAKLVKNVIGIDTSEEMIEVAKENNAQKNVAYHKWDARTIGDNPEWRERFDKVVSFHVLHWFPEHDRALAAILACLKPGGEALVITGHSTTPAFVSIAQFLNSHPKWAVHVKGFEKKLFYWQPSCRETEDLFEASGWTDVQCQSDSVTTFDELLAKSYFKTVLGESALIPESMQEEYLEDLWQWALSEYEEESQPGYVRLPIYEIVIHARKPASGAKVSA